MSIINNISPENRISAAWTAANTFAESQMDTNSRHSINLLLARHTISPLSDIQFQRILEYSVWWEAIWTHYKQVKDSINQGVDARFDPTVPGKCPWTIWQISNPVPIPDFPDR